MSDLPALVAEAIRAALDVDAVWVQDDPGDYDECPRVDPGRAAAAFLASPAGQRLAERWSGADADWTWAERRYANVVAERDRARAALAERSQHRHFLAHRGPWVECLDDGCSRERALAPREYAIALAAHHTTQEPNDG